jgi:DNA-binding CsgD family transcriptional regulator
MLVGREQEVEVLGAVFERAHSGQSSTLVVTGEAGIGKTALLELAVEHASNFAVVRAAGIESESELPYSGISALLRPLLGHLPDLPEPQQAALSSALALGPPIPIDPFTAYAAVLSLLAAAAEKQPLLAVVDDVHWLDAASQQALVFSARRLGAEGVALLVSRRDGEPSLFAAGDFPELPLAGLPLEAAKQLLNRKDRPVDPATVERLVAASGGNPLALIEAVEILSEAQLAGREPLEEPVLFGGGVERAFAHRITALDEEARRAILVVAAGEDLDSAILTSAVRAGSNGSALQRAEAADLISLSGGKIQFRHPLIRSAVYHSASADDRREAHRALASAMPEDAMRQAWHLALAAPEPDETVASRLEETAAEARARNGYLAAAKALELSARLSEATPDRARRLIAAASDSLLAGRVERSIASLDEAAELQLEPEARTELLHLRARVELFGGNPMAGHVILVDLAGRLEEDDPSRAAALLAEACFPCFATAQGRLALQTAERAYALSERASPEVRVMAAIILQQSLLLTGEARRSEQLLDELLPMIEQSDPFAAAQLLSGPTLSLIYLERFEEARRLTNRVLTAARSAGALSMMVLPLGCLVELDYRTGNWPAAMAASTEAARVGTETGHLNLPYMVAMLARVEAVRGNEASAQAFAAQARELAGEDLATAILHFAGYALGLLASGLGRYDDVVAELEPVAQDAEALLVDNPAILLWHPDLIEAYVRLGRTADAERILARLEKAAGEIGRTPQAVAHRCRALLAGEEDFEAIFARALEAHQRLSVPFEQARTELCLGERLRRAGRRTDARRPLRSALATFERLGATPWAERARGELRAVGEAARQRRAPAIDELTAHELQVAVAVAEGATNKQVAARLFLSPKTIDFHLRNIYRKLGIRSRTELARLMLEHEPERPAEAIA